MKNEKTRILLVDDNPLVREGIAALIDDQPDLEVVKAIRGGRKVLDIVRTLSPHVVLVSLEVQNGGGLRLISALRREMPHCRVIGMGLLPTPDEVDRFIQAGAAGFIATNARIIEVLATIRAVARGKVSAAPRLTGLLFASIVAHTPMTRGGGLPRAVRLTARERRIVVRLANGIGDDAIAHEVHLSTDALRSNINNILEKMALYGWLQAQEESSEPNQAQSEIHGTRSVPAANTRGRTRATPAKKAPKNVRPGK